MIKKMYYWKDKQGKIQQSDGIELEDYEKAALCKENLTRVKQQAALNEMTEIAQENGEYGEENAPKRSVPKMDSGKVLELSTLRAKKQVGEVAS